MNKRLFTALLVLAMALALLPSAALADNATNVYVGRQPIPANGASVAIADGGTATYSSGKLTLNGVKVTKGNYYSNEGAAIYANGDLVIELVGESEVAGPDGTNYSCGVAVGGNLTIRGNGQLIATSGDVNTNFSVGVLTRPGDITILGGTVKGIGKTSPDISAGVSALVGSITVSGGSLEGVGGNNSSGSVSYGFSTLDGIILTGGTALAKSGTAPTSFAFDKQPGFGTNKTWYRWRTGASGGYTVSSATEQYVWDASDTYVEIRPVESPIPKTGDTAMPYLWAGLMLLAGAGLVVLRRRRRIE